ncbi:hypothetical protein AWB80_02852 [Caballeronia pedi]|uniref:Uncharacterized protein n=1 Tax=Caballeronia pedi TaxID=1777141 RepID=A0A158AZS8_9BURK|nr:hypothetical protein [Caballeronia pedi]SAK63322.1 hypothetical protein AWB80_02852 [Caballeronia pedi]
MTEREKIMLDALLAITKWPDTGTRYGQKNIKRFAREQLAYAAQFTGEAKPVSEAKR